MKSFVTHTSAKYATTYYVRDPQGNVLAVYERRRGETGQGTLTLTEQHLYGAGRIGMRKRNLALGGGAEEPVAPSTHYALTNHLGNVLAVISDAPGGGTQPTVESLTDYYPFGMAMPGRSYNASAYRFGYTGHEKEGDLAEGVYTTQYRLLDTRLGRWMSVDPLFGKYADMGAYNYCGGNPVVCWDPDGRKFDLSNLNDKQREIFISTIDKLKKIEGEVGEVISFLNDNENFTIIINMNNIGENYFDDNNNIVEWDPNCYIVTNLDFELTPTVLLSHELKHSYDFNKDYDKPIGEGERYLEQLGLEVSNIKNAPNKREDSAFEFETKVAHALEQIPQDAETTRTDYVSKKSYRKETEEK